LCFRITSVMSLATFDRFPFSQGNDVMRMNGTGA
jgi:hypothetical protein